jgi:TatD DNase family protein
VLIDTHAHLDHLPDLDNALKRAHEAGVTGIVAMSMDLKSCRLNLEIKNKTLQPKVYLAMGMHPAEANLADLEKIVEMIYQNKKELCAVGEIGLDFTYKWVRKDEAKRSEQRQVFIKLLEVAKDLNLPAVVHSRGVERECLETVRSVGVKKANFHWYSGPLDVLADIIKHGYVVSCSPSISYSPQSRAAMEHANLENILIETDCPVFFGNKEDGTGFAAEPKDVIKTLDALSKLKKLNKDVVLKQVVKNAQQFFVFN